MGEGGIRQGQGHSRSIHRKEVVGGREEGASGFVDAEFEGHTASELVSLIICGDVGGVDSALHIHLHIGGHVQELHSHQGLRVVHLGQRRKAEVRAHGNSVSSPRTPFHTPSPGEASVGASHGTYVEPFAIVGEVHEVDVAIGREHDKVAKILSIFISLGGAQGGEGESMLGMPGTQELSRLPSIFPLPPNNFCLGSVSLGL